jgi:hypothetical protein
MRDVDAERCFHALLRAAERLGVVVKNRVMKGSHASGGGLCRVRGQHVIVLNSKTSFSERDVVLAEALSGLDLGSVDLEPEILGFIRNRNAALFEPKAKPRARHVGPGLASTSRRRV